MFIDDSIREDGVFRVKKTSSGVRVVYNGVVLTFKLEHILRDGQDADKAVTVRYHDIEFGLQDWFDLLSTLGHDVVWYRMDKATRLGVTLLWQWSS